MFRLEGSVGSFVDVPKNIYKNFDLSKKLVLINKRSELLPRRRMPLPIIKINSTESQILKMSSLGSQSECWIHLIHRSCSTFYLMFQLKVTSPHD